MVINIFKGDQGDEELIEYAQLLNPPNVYNPFEKELIEICQYAYETAMRMQEMRSSQRRG